MSRSLSPLHVHVSRKTPVHVHLKPARKSTSPSRSKRLEQSCAEMSAGRPSLRATSAAQSSRMRASDWARASNSRGPWVPPPGKSTKPRMTWEGPTHRLEIHPVESDTSFHNGTVLRMSDLSGEGGGGEVVVEQRGAGSPYEEKIESLQTEVGALKAEVDLQKSLRSLEEKEKELRMSRASLREKEAELQGYREELRDSEREKLKLKSSVNRLKGDIENRSNLIESQRDRLMKKLVEVEMDSSSVARQAEALNLSIKRLQKERRFSSMHAIDVNDQKDLLLDRLVEFDTSNKSLRKLLRAQQAHESGARHLSEQREVLLQRLTGSDTTNQLLRSQLDEKEKLAMHTQTLHDEIGQKDAEIQSMAIRLQSLEDQLHHRDMECAELETNLQEVKRKAQRDKDSLKRATRQHKDRASQNEQTAEALGSHLEETTLELEQLRTKLTKSTRENFRHEAEIGTLSARVKELEQALAQSKVTSQSSLDEMGARLSEKTHELNSLQLDNDRFKAKINMLEGKLKAVENSSHTKAATLESEVSELQASVAQYEGLVTEYKSQLERSRKECDDLSRELRRKDQEMERIQQENMLEMERSRLKLQQQLTELEPMPEMLKTTELRLRDAQERLTAYDQRASEQTKIISELTTKAEQHNDMVEGLREKWHVANAESQTLSARVETLERRLQESDQQNRELMAIAGKKEETIQKLQTRTEELLQEVSSLNTQMDSNRSENRRHVEQIKDRAASKERVHLARIADLESQLSRANGVASQLRKSKEDADRRHHSRVHELQERLDQANSTKRSMENYVNFLKSSYASIFSDSGNPTSPHSTLLH